MTEQTTFMGFPLNIIATEDEILDAVAKGEFLGETHGTRFYQLGQTVYALPATAAAPAPAAAGRPASR